MRLLLQRKGWGAFSSDTLHPFLFCISEPFPAQSLTLAFFQVPWGRSPSPSKKDKSQ